MQAPRSFPARHCWRSNPPRDLRSLRISPWNTHPTARRHESPARRLRIRQLHRGPGHGDCAALKSRNPQRSIQSGPAIKFRHNQRAIPESRDSRWTRNALLIPRGAIRETGPTQRPLRGRRRIQSRFRLVKMSAFDAERAEFRPGSSPVKRSFIPERSDHRRDSSGDSPMSKPRMAGRLAHAFIHSKLTPLFLVASIALELQRCFCFRERKSRRSSSR